MDGLNAREQAGWPAVDDGRSRRASAFIRRAFAYAVAPTRHNLGHWALCAGMLAMELCLIVVLRDGRIYEWEQDLTRLFQKTPGRHATFDVANFLTNTISLEFMVVFVAVVAAVAALRMYSGAFLLLLTFPVHVLAQFPKAIIERPRPSPAYPGIEGVGGYLSFPSGHAEFVISFYGLLTYLLVGRVRSRPGRWAMVAGWLGLVLTTGFARIAMGRHWPIDVLASYGIGVGVLSGLLWLHHALRAAAREVAPTAPGGAATVDP